MRRRTRWATPFVVVVAGCGHPKEPVAPPSAPGEDAAPAVVSTRVDAAPVVDAAPAIDAPAVVATPVDAGPVRVVNCKDPRGPTCNPPSPRVLEARVVDVFPQGETQCFRAVGAGTQDGVKLSDRGDFVVDGVVNGRVIEATGFRIVRVTERELIGCLEGKRDKLPTKAVRIRRKD